MQKFIHVDEDEWAKIAAVLESAIALDDAAKSGELKGAIITPASADTPGYKLAKILKNLQEAASYLPVLTH